MEEIQNVPYFLEVGDTLDSHFNEFNVEEKEVDSHAEWQAYVLEFFISLVEYLEQEWH